MLRLLKAADHVALVGDTRLHGDEVDPLLVQRRQPLQEIHRRPVVGIDEHQHIAGRRRDRRIARRCRATILPVLDDDDQPVVAQFPQLLQCAVSRTVVDNDDLARAQPLRQRALQCRDDVVGFVVGRNDERERRRPVSR